MDRKTDNAHAAKAYVSTAGAAVNLDRGVVDCERITMIAGMCKPPVGVSVIVPTFREAANVAKLAERVFAAADRLNGPIELLIVDDDSQDGTDEIVRAFERRHAIRLIVRKNERGLSGAVIRGFREAKYDRFVVMDADLQHPPEAIPELLAALERDSCEFVIGSRYAGGAVGADWPWMRKIGSTVATLLARPLVGISDPMSGFFALRRHTWAQATGVSPIGFKIALELMVKGRCRNICEVPITFAARSAGESKLGAGVFWKYLIHLSRLYRFRFRASYRLAVAAAVALIALVAYRLLA